MTEEELKKIEDLLNKTSGDPEGLDWQRIVGREIPGQPGQKRIDMFHGPKVDEPVAVFKFINKGCKQLAHFHPESPTIWEKNENTENDCEWLYQSKKFARIMLEEIKNLKEKLNDKS